MTPEAGAALQIMMGTLMMEVAPNMRDDYRRANVNLLAVAAAFIAQEIDRAVEVRVWENAEMRAIFARAGALVANGALRDRLEAAAATLDTSLRVSQLTAANNDLRRLLIELQAGLEELQASPAAEVNRAVWAFLRESAQRRAIQIG
jgi:hypothetical protein